MDERRIPFVLEVHIPVPTVVISHLSGQTYLIRFSESVSGFDITDIVTVGCTLSDFIGNRVAFCVTVLSTGSPTTLQVPAGVATNAFGRTNEASNTLVI